MSQAKHSRRVKGWTLLETNVLQTAAVWHQILQHRTLAPELRRHGFIHHRLPTRCHSVPLFLLLSHHTLFFSRLRGREGERRGKEVKGRGGLTEELSRCSHPAAAFLSLSFSFFFFFEDVLCSFFFLLFFF